MIFDDLKKANMEALKAKDNNARGIYSVLINKCMLKSVELKAKGKTLSDADTLQIINKTIKELDEECAAYKAGGREENVKAIEYQKSLVVKYLPKLMSEEEIVAEINKLEDKSVKNVMIHFKTNFAGKCDMKQVSELAKKLG